MTPKQFAVLYRKHKSIAEIGRQTGMTKAQTMKLSKAAQADGLMTPVKGSRPKRKVSMGDFIVMLKKHQSLRAITRNEGLYLNHARRLHAQAVERGLIEPLRNDGKGGIAKAAKGQRVKLKAEGSVQAKRATVLGLPKPGKRKVYLLTGAQNATKLHNAFWGNIQAYLKYLNDEDSTCESAELHISRVTYLKKGIGAGADKGNVTGRGKKDDLATKDDTLWWVGEINDYLSDDRIEVAPGLEWCGEMNILPTATDPLSGLTVYGGRKSTVFPHPRVAMRSVASSKNEPTKFVYTTGVVTQRNYIQRKAGLKAEFHHVFGCLQVEVDSDGDWFCRQLNADSSGTFYDMDTRVRAGKVTHGHRVKGVNWGDTHVIEIDPVVKELAWGQGQMKDTLRPEFEFHNDLISFRGPSHHELKNAHLQFQRYVEGNNDVRKEITAAANFLAEANRPWCHTVVVPSNHHDHIGRWLNEQDGRKDPLNAEFWLAISNKVYQYVRNGGRTIDIDYLRIAMEVAGFGGIGSLAEFLKRDESFIICPDANGGIECGGHGDKGPNGSRGSARALAKLGRKQNIGHSHEAGIYDGVFQSGACAKHDSDWSSGPSSHSHTHTVTYPNGKRAQYTMFNGKWRAKTKTER